MKRSRSIKKYVESSDSENEPLKKKSSPIEAPSSPKHIESSSESDIENYLLKPGKVNLNSQFFNPNVAEFEKVEKDIFSGITKLGDTDSDTDSEKVDTQPQKGKSIATLGETSSRMNFKQLQDYTKQIEEAKRHIEIYKAKKEAKENPTDILNLLAAGERNLSIEQNIKPADLHSSDFESCDSEQEDWEEIKTKTIQENEENNILPQSSLQITVDMPTNVKKKKGVDLLAAMKRRLNRIRKENQVLVHKVHLLCWLAHGNYVNLAINDTETLARALSLLPSEQCYPSDRVDLSYLEQIVIWYKRTVKNIEKPVPETMCLDKCLQIQISRKEAYNKKMLICIFVAVFRALGIQCRIVMSLQVEPLRPPVSELHTVSTTSNEKKGFVKEPATINKSSSKASAGTQPKIESTSSKHNGTKLDMSSKLKQDVTIKSKSTRNPTSKGNNVKIDSKATSSKKYKSSDINADKNEEEKSVKTEKRKSNRPKITQNENKIKLGKEKNEQSSNKNGESSKAESKPVERALQKNTMSKKKDTNRTSESSKTKGTSKGNLEDLTSTGSKASMKGNNSKQRSFSTRKLSESMSKNKNKLELNCSNQKTKMRTKSSGSKDPGQVKSTEDGSNRILRTKTKKSIVQVDGIDDSDSDEDIIILQLDGANDNNEDKKKRPKRIMSQKSSRSQSEKIKSQKTKETDSESEFEPSPEKRKRFSSTLGKCNLKKLTMKKEPSAFGKKLDVRNEIVNLIKGRITEQKQVDRKRLAKKGKSNVDSDSSDSDYVPEAIKKKFHESDDDFVPKTKVKRRIQPRSVLSESENDFEKNKKKGNDVWLEVFLEAEEKWISVDVIYGQVHCVKEIYQRASHPVSYVLAWDNNNNLKDVTQRYCQNFNTVTRKQRVDSKWWNDSIKPFIGPRTARDKEEDDDLARQQLDQPLPKAISEYKNHPLYALKRHLLKFEAIYPPEPPTLGFIRGEAVYPRGCVFTLHSRDIWLKQAKVVKLGEQPYKIVKARPKYDRLSNKMITDQLLEIFGPWQVQDYEPPTAENGIVPKNAFGNVDLFKPCMIPKGCVHLKLPGLNKIARKMNIDIASAIVGFDFHGGWSHPVYDGFIVCKEYEDQLISVWELEQDELDRKEEEKINKRVYGNWRKLIKGLLIRERLKAKYDFGEPSTSKPKDKKNKAKSSTK